MEMLKLKKKIMSKFASPFMAKSPLKEKQSLQSKYRKFKAKAGNKIRKFLGESDPAVKDPKDYNLPGFEARVPQAVNMTPDVSEEEAKAVRNKFDATYMKSDNPINHCGPNHKMK
jgi:hypothetical protein